MNDTVNVQVQQQQQLQQAQQWAAMQALIKQEENQRTSTDSSMVQALNRGPV